MQFMPTYEKDNIANCLKNETNELVMDQETIAKARKSVERMTEIGR